MTDRRMSLADHFAGPGGDRDHLPCQLNPLGVEAQSLSLGSLGGDSLLLPLEETEVDRPGAVG